MTPPDGQEFAVAADLLGPDALNQVRALAELLFRKGLITPAELDEVRASRAAREANRERLWGDRLWAGLTNPREGPLP